MLITALKKLFESESELSQEEDREHALRLSTATLLVEVCRADFQEQPVEIEQISLLLTEHFSLSDNELEALMQQGRKSAEELVSLQHVTRLLNEQCNDEMKVRVIEMMWQVVYADGVKDHYEEHLIRQVADLVSLTLNVFLIAIIIHVILSWINPGQYNPVIGLVNTLAQPFLRLIRKFIPDIGGLDLSPIFATLVIMVAKLLFIPPLIDIGTF